MRHLLPSLAALSLCSPCLAETAATPTRTILVLDASGSMWGQIDGRAKIEIAREVIGGLVDKLPDNTELGLVAYGHREKGNCDDIELLIPPGPLDRAAFKKTVNALQPKGMTPLTAAVVYAAENLRSTELKATVILVTDGEETCDRDPCEAAKTLEETGVDFTAHVVAFDLDEKAAKSVECLAKGTGGLFLKADNAATLADALQTVIEPEEETPAEEMPGEATISGPANVVAGGEFEVTWTGPDGKGDYITIVPKALEDASYRNYSYTRSGSPLKITSIVDEGDAEIRYVHGRTQKVLARADIKVVPAEISLKAPASAMAGALVEVTWTGPNNKGDYVTIVPKNTEEGRYLRYQYTARGNPLKIEAPLEPGEAEIRYQTENSNKVLARIPIVIEKAEVTLQAPASAPAGSEVEITWTGPNNERDYITIVPKDTEDGRYARYTYTEKGSPLKVTAPVEPGVCEVRYHSGQGDKVLARIPLNVTAVTATLKAPATAKAGEEVEIEWTGPNNKGDYITIVPKSANDGEYRHYSYTETGSPLKVKAPDEADECEIRYQSGDGDKVLFRIAIKVE